MRIVSGRFGGRRLVAPKDDATRPTSEKVREAVFSALGSIAGLRVLDLYAGTGALGLEAISRGASFVAFVEARRVASDALKKNVASLGLRDEVACLDRRVDRAKAALSSLGPFDLVFADPPYADVDSGEVARALDELLVAPLVDEDALLILEHSSKSSPPSLARFTFERERRYGDTSVSTYERGRAESDAAST